MEYFYLTILFLVRLITKYYDVPVFFQFIIYSVFLFYYVRQPAEKFVKLLIFNFIISSFVIGIFVPLELNYISLQLAAIILFKVIIGRLKFSFENQVWFVLFFIYLLFSSFISDLDSNNPKLVQSRNEIILFALLFYIFLNIIGYKNSWFNSIIIIQAVTFCALYVIVLSLFNINFSEREVVDLNDNYKLSSAALLPDRNYASGLISFGIGLLFTELERIRSKFLIFLLLIVFFGSQLILASRGGIITSLAILIFIMIYESVRKKRKSFRLLILIFPILLSLVVFDTSLIRDRFKEESIEDQSGRSEIRQESFSKYMNQDLLEKTLGGGSFHGYTTLAFNKSIHNNFLEVLYDYGLIGVVIFLVSIFRVWRMQLFNKVNILIYCIVSLSLSPIISVVYWVFLVVSFTPYSLKLNKGD
jgi:oligosaccharide repeat unit polymerase